MSTSTKRRLADALLDGGLDTFVNSRLSSGKSWRQVSIDLRDAVDVDVHEHTLKRWFRGEEDGATAPQAGAA
jgi:hypothetical protein